MSAEIRIDPRFCGPDASANGGYACGRLAAHVRAAGAVEVTLRKPPPLGREMRVEAGDPVRLMDGDAVVAEARAAVLDLEAPEAPTFEDATSRADGYLGRVDHRFPLCFACGTKRPAADGLGLSPGPGADGRVAAPWIPDASLAGPDGTVRPEILWAALDCPGYWAAAGPDQPLALLGRMTAEVTPGIAVGERCVVVGWSLGREGRKLQAATALFDGSGRLRGRSRQTWIVV